jgi:hypothetical protein
MNACRSPKTALEFEHYYKLRWQILRQPWGQVLGSERDSLEQEIIDEDNKVLAVGRLDSKRSFWG